MLTRSPKPSLEEIFFLKLWDWWVRREEDPPPSPPKVALREAGALHRAPTSRPRRLGRSRVRCAPHILGTRHSPKMCGCAKASKGVQGDPGPALVQAWEPLQGWRRAIALRRRSCVHPLAGFPSQTHLQEHPRARPLWLTSTATHTETPTQIAHTFTPTLSTANMLPRHTLTNAPARTLIFPHKHALRTRPQ